MNGLISTKELAKRIGSPDLVVLDIRSAVFGGGRPAYEAAHIPGAVHSDYAAAGWRVLVGGAPGVMPQPAQLTVILGDIGLKPEHSVVIIPAGIGPSDFAAAARVYWTLKSVGHGQLAILDGGMAAWIADTALPIETGAPRQITSSTYPVHGISHRAQAEDVLNSIRASSAVLVDARSGSYFQGREKSAESKAFGHIPGAQNVDYVTAFDSVSMRLKTLSELEELFSSVPQNPIISYCNTGHTAALNWFVLSEILGRNDVRLYDGSMTDWTQDITRPVVLQVSNTTT